MAKYILLVDDDALFRPSLAFNLEQASYRASTAASAEEALMAARVNPPDLVLLDINLPGIDGLDALREGSVAEAHQILVDTIENFHTDGNKNGLTFALDKMASLYVVINHPELAARLIGWSDATRQEIGDPRPRIEQTDLDEDIAAIKAKLGVDAYETAYNSGWGLTLNEVVAFALVGKK